MLGTPIGMNLLILTYECFYGKCKAILMDTHNICFYGELITKLSLNTLLVSSRKHLRTKVTPDFHLTYSKNGGNLGSETKR